MNKKVLHETVLAATVTSGQCESAGIQCDPTGVQCDLVNSVNGLEFPVTLLVVRVNGQAFDMTVLVVCAGGQCERAGVYHMTALVVERAGIRCNHVGGYCDQVSATVEQQALLTALQLVAHVSAVVVAVALPDAADAFAVGAAILAGQAGVLWRRTGYRQSDRMLVPESVPEELITHPTPPDCACARGAAT